MSGLMAAFSGAIATSAAAAMTAALAQEAFEAQAPDGEN